MAGPQRRSSKGTVLDFFEGARHEPFTATEIADATEYSLEIVTQELSTFVDQGILETKSVAGTERVWWLSPREQEEDERSDVVLTDATGDEVPNGEDRQLLQQHRQLAEFVTQINISDNLDELLRLITEEARDLVGAHQSVTSRTINQNWEQAINAVSLSDKYAEYRDYDTEPDGSGIYSLVCERNEPMRVTQEELESHPAWKAFGDEGNEHPPMRGWLAVPIIGPEGENRGLIQLSDKYQGQFTETDEAILIQLANVASAAIENSRLYDELRESERRYRTLFESMTEGYGALEKVDTASRESPEFRFVEANPAFEALTGHDEVEGKTIREVMSGGDQEWLDVLENIVEAREPASFERELKAQDRVFQGHAFPIDDAPKGDVGVTVKDITERVEHERRLEESNERLEQFAYAASHDLQEPLRMVSSYLQMIEQRYADDLDEDAREFIEFAVDGADRMREMVEGLLAYSRIESQGNPTKPVDLNTVLEDARADLQVRIEESNAELTVGDLPVVEGDSNQLRQVFQNLLENAIEYSGDEPPRIHVGAERTGGNWVVSVEDKGIGIDPEEANVVFGVFERLHSRDEHPGTGIGLAVCERIVERHGGEIWVDSAPDEGATFCFTLPSAKTDEQ